MTMIRIALTGLALLALAACESPYQPEKFGGLLQRDGGFSERQVEPYAYIVRFAGNDWTEREQAEWYALYRAAEITLQVGGDFFVVVDSNLTYSDGQAAATGDPRVGGYVSPNALQYGSGYGQYGGYRSPFQFASVSPDGGPVAEAFVRVFSGQTPPDLRGAYDARRIISEGR